MCARLELFARRVNAARATHAAGVPRVLHLLLLALSRATHVLVCARPLERSGRELLRRVLSGQASIRVRRLTLYASTGFIIRSCAPENWHTRLG